VSKLSVLLDACVLLPFCLSHTLLTAAQNGLYQVHFSNRILDEAIRNLVNNRKKRMTQAQADNLRLSWLNYFPEALIEDFPAALENKMDNHPKDRHVLAAAVYSRVDIIVTCNVSDFPSSSIKPWNIDVMHPDAFLTYLCDEYGDETLWDFISKMIDDYKKPPCSYLNFFSHLEKEEPKFSSRMLIIAYGEFIKNFVINSLVTVTNPNKGQRCLNGKTYKIFEDKNSIIIKKNHGQEIFRLCDDEVTGDIRTEDIQKFEMIINELPELPILQNLIKRDKYEKAIKPNT
jgi:predicted nucleic acid-binding protein